MDRKRPKHGHGLKGTNGVIMGIILPLIFLISLSVGLLIYSIVTSSKRTTTYLHKQRALDIAQAGTQDALFWFRRQTVYPVASFVPGSSSSEDSTLGLVKTLVIDDRNLVKGRFIVEKTNTQDLTTSRGEIGAGWIWRISSRGIVFVEKDSSKAFNVSPNHILEDVRITTEFRMLNISPTVDAAIVVTRGNQFTAGARSQIIGGSSGTSVAGVAYKQSGGIVTQSGYELRGDPAQKAVSSLILTPRDIFGIDQATLKNFSDFYSEEGASGLPSMLPDFSLIYIQGNCTFNASQPLSGGGILFVNGNLVMATGSNSSFTGLIYATGTIVAGSPCWIEGQMIAEGGGTVGVGGYDKATIVFNKEILNIVSQVIGNYRKNRSYSIQVLK
jgi:hypothetical protein